MNNRMRDLSLQHELVRNNYPDDILQTRLVWAEVDDKDTLQKFLASNMQWADISALVSRIYFAKKFGSTDYGPGTDLSRYEYLLRLMVDNNKGVRVDLVSEFIDVKGYLEIIDQFGFRPEQLWFRTSPDRFSREDIRHLAAIFPDSIIECQVDFLPPLLSGATAGAKDMLEWLDDTIQNDVSGFDAFLQAVLTGPPAIVPDFSFPEMGTVTHRIRESNISNA